MLKTHKKNKSYLKRLNILFGLFAISLLLSSTIAASSVHADIIPPKHQAKIGIPSEDIVCDSGLFKVIRAATDSVACVKPQNVSKLIIAGWAKSADEKALNEMMNKVSVNLGKINILEIVPIKLNVGKLASNTPIGSYDVIFDVCASSPIYAPDILITSDSETKRFEMAETIHADSCILSATKIKASDLNSIKISLQNKGDISEKIIRLQNELDSLKEQLSTVRQSFKNPDSPDAQKQGQKIADLRKQINDKREELHRILFAVHASPTSKVKIEKMTFSGQKIEGQSAKILSVKESLTPGIYDAIFEACAGQTTVRLPVIVVSSDKQSLNVKLGDKISANSCQMTSVKIEAGDILSITVTPAGNAESSNKAVDLEVLIGSLQRELSKEKETLKSLMFDPKRPENFTEILDSHVTKIAELRNQISNAKAELNKILYLTYN